MTCDLPVQHGSRAASSCFTVLRTVHETCDIAAACMHEYLTFPSSLPNYKRYTDCSSRVRSRFPDIRDNPAALFAERIGWTSVCLGKAGEQELHGPLCDTKVRNSMEPNGSRTGEHPRLGVAQIRVVISSRGRRMHLGQTTKIPTSGSL